jgi:cellulose synthase/poly-beta-1,6-N-acetylglucosamine synthase-like glycosyltransferase
MDWYYYIAAIVILLQFIFLGQMYGNFRYALKKYRKERSGYRPRTVLIVPCKGLDSAFAENISSLFNQDYDNYLLWFVVADKSDPAYVKLCELKEKLGMSSRAEEVQILVAGQAKSCGQKVHNLLYCYEKIDSDIEVMAFADSDVCMRSNWLSHLVYPLRQTKTGVASGYRWFIPRRNNPASLALSAINAKVAQFLGNSRFNQAWGGSMAVRVDVFRRLGIDTIWRTALSDDLSLSWAVKKAGLKVVFVPACMVASYESTTWGRLFEFGRRQFLITRVSYPRTWWFGFMAALFSVLGLWGTLGIAVYAAADGFNNLRFFFAVPVVFFLAQMGRAVLRQKMIMQLLKEASSAMRAARWADILLFWVWSLLLLGIIVSSAFGRTIRWRGIWYKLLGPTEAIVVEGKQSVVKHYKAK